MQTWDSVGKATGPGTCCTLHKRQSLPLSPRSWSYNITWTSLLLFLFSTLYWLRAGFRVLICFCFWGLAHILHLGGDLITLALFYMFWIWFVSQITHALTPMIACRPLPRFLASPQMWKAEFLRSAHSSTFPKREHAWIPSNIPLQFMMHVIKLDWGFLHNIL